MPILRHHKNLGILLMILSVFGSAGGHLFALQSMAWASMFWDNAHRDGALVAIQKTFDGKHPCGRCHEIAADQARRNSIPASEVERRFDPCDLPTTSFTAQARCIVLDRWLSPASRLVAGDSIPPTPPPKSSPSLA